MAGLALLLAACGGTTGSAREGGESHFMRSCFDGGCGAGLQCLGSRCTRACDESGDDCSALSPLATCKTAGTGEAASCALPCVSSADCSALTGGLCVAGWCEAAPVRQAVGSGASAPRRCNASTGFVAEGVTCYEANRNMDCLDDPTDSCNPTTDADCAGTCQEVQLEHICSGLGMAGPCPDELECVSPVRSSPEEDFSGQCLSSDVRDACKDDELACASGFICVQGTCFPRDADCSSEITCLETPTTCPPGYAVSRAHLADGTACGGPCIPVQRCACKGDANCATPAVCVRGTCELSIPP